MPNLAVGPERHAGTDILSQRPIHRPRTSTKLGCLFIPLFLALTVFVRIGAAQSPAAAGSISAGSTSQSILVQAGFKSKAATTARQRRHLQTLPEHQFTWVKQNGESFYVWADKPNNRLYSGNDQAYHNYKELRRIQKDRVYGAITTIDEPRGIAVPVTVFHDWAPFSELFGSE